MKKILLSLIAIFMIGSIEAQINTPAASPSSTVKQTVGLTEVTVEYSRPGAKGRLIYAEDGLVSFGKLWRTGANAATKVTFGDDVKIEGADVKAGSYALLTIPGAYEWTVNFYPYDSWRWTTYKEATPAASIVVAPYSMKDFEETFLISFSDFKIDGATMKIMWERTVVPIGISTNTDKQVMSKIEEVMAGPSSNDYYAAANYFYTSGKDMNQALTWIQKATKVDSPKFWQVRKEALILAELERYKEAIAAAELSKKLAMEAGNDEYVKMNEKSIAEWSK